METINLKKEQNKGVSLNGGVWELFPFKSKFNCFIWLFGCFEQRAAGEKILTLFDVWNAIFIRFSLILTYNIPKISAARQIIK